MDVLISIIVATALIIGPLAVFGIAAVRFGADSRPGVDDPDRRPWLVPTS